MNVQIFVRHSAKCPKRKNRYWKKCKCPKWLYSSEMKPSRVSAKTRSFERAERKATELQRKIETAERAARPFEGPRPKTVEEAIASFIASKQAQALDKGTIQKYHQTLRGKFLHWCERQGILQIKNVTFSDVNDFRATWTGAPLSRQRHQERLKTFFRFCYDSEWVEKNYAARLSPIRVEQKPTLYFPKDEYEKLIAGCSSPRLHALIQYMRWSGLAIEDACTSERSRLSDQNELFLYRAKTGVPVTVPIPRAVAAELRSLEGPSPKYFWWTGNGEVSNYVKVWQRQFRKLARKLKLDRNEDGTKRRAHPHMLRDTFAVEYLLAGMPLEDVSKLLGHSSIKVTERHYNPFVKARKEQLIASVKSAWTKLGIPGPEKRQNGGKPTRSKARAKQKGEDENARF